MLKRLAALAVLALGQPALALGQPALALGQPALAQTTDGSGVTTFQEGIAGQTLAMAQYDVVTAELGLTPIGAGHPAAAQFDHAVRAVFVTLENNGECEVIKPGDGEPAWDGYCSSDNTLQVCDGAGCYGGKGGSSSPGVVFEVLGARFSPDQTSADVYASIGWEGKDRKVRLAWFHYVVKVSDGKWKVASAENLRSKSVVKLPAK